MAFERLALLRLWRSFLPRGVRRVARPLLHIAYGLAVRVWCFWSSQFDRQFIRRTGEGPLPPSRLRFQVGETPSQKVFVEVGRQTASAIEGALQAVGRPLTNPARVLDFGCGCGRTLIPLMARHPEISWLGCDTDSDSIDWCQVHLPAGCFTRNQPTPPVPGIESGSIDLIYAISVFTHLDAAMQGAWVEEFARLLRPGGLLLLTFYSEQVWRHLDHETAAQIEKEGIVSTAARPLSGFCGDWNQTTFQTPADLESRLEPGFSVLRHIPEGMGYMDVMVAERVDRVCR